jgi:hypothetical protein
VAALTDLRTLKTAPQPTGVLLKVAASRTDKRIIAEEKGRTMNTLMNNNLRIVGFITGILLLVLTLGFVFQFPWVVNLWPWPESRLSYLFLGSILAAITVAVVSVLCLFVQKSIYIGPIRAGGAIMVAALYNLQRYVHQGEVLL